VIRHQFRGIRRSSSHLTIVARTLPAIVAAGNTARKMFNARGLRSMGTAPALPSMNISDAAPPAIAARHRRVRYQPNTAPVTIASATAKITSTASYRGAIPNVRRIAHSTETGATRNQSEAPSSAPNAAALAGVVVTTVGKTSIIIQPADTPASAPQGNPDHMRVQIGAMRTAWAGANSNAPTSPLSRPPRSAALVAPG